MLSLRTKNDSEIHMPTTLSLSVLRVSRFREEFNIVTADYPPGHLVELAENKDYSITVPLWKHIRRTAGRCLTSRKSSQKYRSSLSKPETEIVAPIPSYCMVDSNPSNNPLVGSSNDIAAIDTDGGVSTPHGWATYVADDTDLYREGSYGFEGKAEKREFVNTVDTPKGPCEGEPFDEEMTEWGILIDGL
jgi:hypothetical protein